MGLPYHPCINELSKVVAQQSNRAGLKEVLNKSCRRRDCPVHGPRGIAGLLLQIIDTLSDLELRRILQEAARL